MLLKRLTKPDFNPVSSATLQPSVAQLMICFKTGSASNKLPLDKTQRTRWLHRLINPDEASTVAGDGPVG
jgi:hypothetical protein